MATFDQIKQVRLTIQDPAGFINFVEVASQGSLPSPHVNQTAYRTTDTGEYWWYNGAAYAVVNLLVSDADISTWIDLAAPNGGVDGAVRKAIERIMMTLPGRMQWVKNADGAESTEYQRLLDVQKFYRQWLADHAPVDSTLNTGLYLRSKTPCVAGGNV